MPAITAVPPMRAMASSRRWTGTRETSSTVSSSARGGHAAMACEIGLSRALSTLAHTDAATPMARVARTAHWKRRNWPMLARGSRVEAGGVVAGAGWWLTWMAAVISVSGWGGWGGAGVRRCGG